MQRYGVSDLGQPATTRSDKNANYFLKKYPDLLTSLTTYSTSRLKCEGRILRRDTERIKRIRRFRRQPNLRLRQFESAFFHAMDHKILLFSCPMCRNVLKGPVTVECGHTFCSDCLTSSLNNCSRCVVCAMDLTYQNRCVNVLVQDLLEKWRERNKCNSDIDCVVPEAADILGLEPRYHLRSGYAGLQINNNMHKIIDFRYHKEKIPRYKNESRILRNSHFYNSPLKENTENCDYFQETLENIFKEVDDIKEALKNSWDCITVTDLECILCSRCLLDPVTTDCGHTFCRGCLTRVLDHRLSCPLCMATLNVRDYSRGSTVVLQQAIQFLVPKDFKERVSVNLKESVILERSSDIPVFVCTNAFPGVACPLYVCEPRYRLLARRCLQSPTKRFAMASKESNGNKFVQFGTILEVKDAVNLGDGRYILTTVGVKRFKVISRNEQDGYDTAKVQYVKDSVVLAEKVPELLALHEKVYSKASKWIRSLKPKVLAEVERLIGQMPNVEKNWLSLPDGPSWTWWLMPILPLSSQLQVGFLSTTSLEKRLRAIDKMFEHMNIRMKALERNTVACSQEEDSLDSCAESEQAFEMPFSEN
ncbi:LON peptidase N-terminal domain and RING finger protein 2 isoform X2 [Anoplophora glabripennis]|uniref:LON peptidase N-terminal domain and RING finger protein 2 isoform X2 n=1 Tax=Anoplophora glabripennis TaxID=217634 RepID=UPI000873689B|nr:LON peptidase N-terminal domain and RING finger protein 2 isoform X2 [Anoplophora glabripennis]